MFFLHNKFNFHLSGLIIFINIMILAFPASAANSQIVDIQSDYLLLDETNGVSEYKGKVLFKKGTLVIKADAITLYYDGEMLTKALIHGTPADVQHAPDNEDKVHSQAREMEYFVAEDKLLLKGQAFVDQGSRHFSGETIEYNTRQRIFTASGNQDNINNEENKQNAPPNGRVHVIIGPAASNKETTSTDTEEAQIKNE